MFQDCKKVVKRSDGEGPTELRVHINRDSFNGVFISCGEEVTILEEQTADDGTPYYQVMYGKRKGWIKKEHIS